MLWGVGEIGYSRWLHISAGHNAYMSSNNYKSPLHVTDALPSILSHPPPPTLHQTFQMAQILWAVAIACVLRDVTVNLRMYHPREQKALMRRFHVAVWGAALLSTLLPFTTDSYGSTGSWCWIETNPTSDVDVGTMWRYLVLYCPLWAGESVWSR